MISASFAGRAAAAAYEAGACMVQCVVSIVGMYNVLGQSDPFICSVFEHKDPYVGVYLCSRGDVYHNNRSFHHPHAIARGP